MARNSPLQPHSSARVIGTRLALVALVVAVGYLVYEFGRIQANYNIVDAAQERQAYEDRIAGLEREIVGLKEEIALLETHRDIDREAYREVEASLTSLQAKIVFPMAASLAFGILFATVITLLLIPTLYLILDDFKQWWKEAWSHVLQGRSRRGDSGEPGLAQRSESN